MNFALELFLTTGGMIFLIVIVAEIISKVAANYGGDK